MPKGKYSPTVYRMNFAHTSFDYNAKGEIPPSTWGDGEYDEEIHFADYDECGFDSYGYSAYDANGRYVGIGMGVDRNGITEQEYSCMSDEEFDACF